MVLGIGKAVKYVPVRIANSCIFVSPELINRSKPVRSFSFSILF